MEKLLQLSLNFPLGDVLGIVGILLFLYMSLCYLAAVVKKKADFADLAWGPGFILVAWTSLILGRITVYGLIVNTLITIWAIRLALHIYLRNRNRDEDFRYQSLKKKWGNFYLRLFSDVFLLQGCILYVVALPVIWIHTHPAKNSRHILWIALPVWLIGFVIETIADRQLAVFKRDPSNKNKLFTLGLWSYVRHPNYLGELIQWWAIWVMAAFLPFGWALIISPVLLTFLIVYISGIQPLEEKLLKRADFKVYAKNTPSLIPFSLANGVLCGITWFVLVSYGNQNSGFISIIIALGCFVIQLILFSKFDKISLRTCIPMSIFALVLGLLQEIVFIHLKILFYPNDNIFPPPWILVLYPLFSLTLNSSLKFLNQNLVVTFLLGGFGALLSYLSGERLGLVQLSAPLAYPIIFLLWGVFLTILIILNRNLRRYFSHIR